MDRPSLSANVWRALQGNILFAACQFGMLLVLARTQSPEDVGRYALALAITGPVFVLSDLRLRAIQVSRPRDTYSFGHYLGNRLTMSLVSVGAVAVVSIVTAHDSRTLLTICAVSWLRMVESLHDVSYGAYEVRERFSPVRNALAIRGLGGLAAFSSALLLTDRVELAVLSASAVAGLQLLRTLLGLRRLRMSLGPRWNKESLVALTLLALPVGASFAVGILTANLPRYWLQGAVGTSALGIYAAVAYLPVLTNVVMDAVAQAGAPRLGRYFADGDVPQFRRLLAMLVAMGAAIGLVGVVAASLWGAWALSLAFGAEYEDGASTLVILAFAASIQYVVSFVRVGLLAMNRYKAPLVASLANIAAVATVLLCAPRLTLEWAGGSIAAGQIAALVVTALLYRRAIRANGVGNRASIGGWERKER